MSMFPSLKERVQTASYGVVALAMVMLLGGIFGPHRVFTISLILIALVACIEWIRMARRDPILAVLGLAVLGTGFWASHALERNNGWPLVIWMLSMAMLSDTAAYGFGSWFKGPKLYPRWSPKKTVSGAVASLMVVLIVGTWSAHRFLGVSINVAFKFSLIVALCAQAGDLIESAAKRRCGVKDSGTWLAGHGGLLDRVDSWLGAAVGLWSAIFFTS